MRNLTDRSVARNFRLTIAAAFTAFIPAIGTAQVDAKATTLLATQLFWDEVPSAAQMSSLYPEKALKARIGMLTTIRCAADQSGALEDCALMREGPPMGYDFGIASIKAANFYKLHMTNELMSEIRNGGVSIVIPFTWTPPPGT